MALTCTICNTINVAGARFCNQCGAALQQGTSSPSPMLATGLLPGQALLRAGRYQVLETIGQGGMGAVYKALDLQLSNRVVAIKEMSQQGLGGKDLQEAIAAFKREASMLAHLTHPGLPRIYEQFEDGVRRYLVMEFIVGETLEQKLEKMQKRGQHFSVEEVLELGCKLCVVLEYLHTQQPPIIFRDLKPGNIMLSPRGQVYLIDFGIARFFKPGQAKDTVALGSAGYAPPEQYRQASSPRSDIYSLGATLHYALTGDDPSQKPFLFRRFSANQSAFERLILSMVTLDEQMRPQSMQEVHKKLEQITQQLSVPQVTVQPVGSGQKQAAPTRVSAPRLQVPPVPLRSPSPPPPSRQQTANAVVHLGILLSGHPDDQRLWQSIRGQLTSLINGFPAVQIQEIEPEQGIVGLGGTGSGGSAGSGQARSLQVDMVDAVDPVLFLLSQDFVDSQPCMALAQHALDRRDTDKIETLAIYLRPCAIQDKRLAAVSSIPEDAVYHASLYAQEQRVLEVAKEIRRLLVTRIIGAKKTGPMNLLHWLLWQLYGYGQGTCPYFTVGAFFVRNMRPSGMAGVMLHLFDLQKDRMLGEYIIGPLLCNDLVKLLQVIAPGQSDAMKVMGVAGRGNPVYKKRA